jgi:hypothetical protein
VTHDDFLHIAESPRGATCDIHSWPTKGLGHRLVVAMRERHGNGGVNACVECIERARNSLATKGAK